MTVIFFRAAWNAERCMSVSPSVKRVDCDKTEERSVRFLYHTKDHLVYSEKKNDWWGRPILPEILGQANPVGAKWPIFRLYSLVAL